MRQVREHIVSVMKRAFDQIGIDAVDPNNLDNSLSYPDIKFGHLSSNIVFRLASQLDRKPAELAQDLIEAIKGDEVIEKITFAPPGHINFILTNEALLAQAQLAISDWSSYFTPDRATNSKRVMVVDYAHPNIGKPMAVHHMLSTIIGDAVKLMHRTSGWKVIADSFIGDMGTQFGKLIWAVKQWGDLSVIEKDPVPELQKLYVKFHIEADSDTSLDDAGREEYRKLEEGDEYNRALWRKITDWSKAEIAPIFDELAVEFDYQNGESFYEDKIASIIELGKSKEIFVADQGALIYRMSDPSFPPAIIQKSDGASLYITRDLARIDYWQKQWHPEVMVNVVDVAQVLQFKQLFEVAERLGLTRAKQKHVVFGRMQFKDSSMSTRKGNVLLVKELIDESKTRAYELVRSKTSHLDESERQSLANHLAIAALKYNILRQNRQTNIIFDWDSMLNLHGSSAPYVAYGLSRANSLQKRLKLSDKDGFAVFDKLELDLLRDILTLNEALNEACAEYRPNILLQKLYVITQKYSYFYNERRISEPNDITLQNSRLLLNNLYFIAVRAGFRSLGIDLPIQM